MDALSTSAIQAGAILKVVSGQYAGYNVIVLSVDESLKMARVALAVFGGVDETPFEIEIDALKVNGREGD